MRFLGNFLWCIFGGGILAFLWGVVGLICCCTIIGIPMGLQCFKFAYFMIWPFGRDIYYSNQVADFVWNMLWVVLFGWELAILAFVVGLIWCITIIGIPFGTQCFKFARLALMPFGAQFI